MSGFFAPVVRPALKETASALSPLDNAFWGPIARHLERRAAAKSLRQLDDRALQDIGLARDQIESAVYGIV